MRLPCINEVVIARKFAAFKTKTFLVTFHGVVYIGCVGKWILSLK